jgi:hypothetical protein
MQRGKTMKKSYFAAVFFLILAFGSTGNYAAATIFLSGDSNITNPLTGSFSVPIDAGNKQFFANILQGGTKVVVLESTSVGSVESSDTDINTFYNSLAGVTSTVISGTVTAAQLTGANLFVAPLPDDAFSDGEITALSTFLAGGGSIFFLGENSNSAFVTANAAINSALSALGSGMSIIPGIFDSGFNTATGVQIASDAFTSGVNTFSYAAPSPVSGGTDLFFGTEHQPFVAYEGSAKVPEPSILILIGSGLIGIGGVRKKLRK